MYKEESINMKNTFVTYNTNYEPSFVLNCDFLKCVDIKLIRISINNFKFDENFSFFEKNKLELVVYNSNFNEKSLLPSSVRKLKFYNSVIEENVIFKSFIETLTMEIYSNGNNSIKIMKIRSTVLKNHLGVVNFDDELLKNITQKEVEKFTIIINRDENQEIKNLFLENIKIIENCVFENMNIHFKNILVEKIK